MHNKHILWLTSVSSLVLATTGALAQQASDQQVEQVVVTGSLVVTNGFQAPTPVTVVSSDQLRSAAPSVVEGLQQLPTLGTSTSNFSPSIISGAGNSTTSGENLRNLGAGRTLVLLDGMRAQPGYAGGIVDTSMFPDLLIKRVDIVTGGASAVYGSDAMAGVLNFVLDTDFTGLKAEVKGGVSGQSDAPLYGLAVAGGTSFDDDRGHIVFSADTFGQSGLDGHQRDWDNEGWSSFSTGGTPQYLLRKGVTTVNALSTGIITSSPLSGTAFNPNGTPYQFQYTGPINSAGNQEIGPGGLALPNVISAGGNMEHLFTNVKYDVNDRVSLFVQGSYGYSSSTYPIAVPYYAATSAFTIYSGNAYLPSSIQTAMTNQGISSFQMGKIWTDLGAIASAQINTTYSVYAGADVKLWGDWKLDTYFEDGDNHQGNTDGNLPIRYNLYNAVDAVVNPATGAVVCRSTLTNPNNGCVPVNLFGDSSLTSAQRNYIIGQNTARALSTQQVASATMNGTLLQDWAGDITAAAGFTYRREYSATSVDPISTEVINCAAQGIRGCPATINGLTGGYTNVNIQPAAGHYDVKEGFGELLIPLAKNIPFAEELDVDAAYRYAEYSAAGDATTWKVGMTWQPVDEFRFRASMSRDLRAPNVSELYGGFTFGVGTVLDPSRNNAATSNVFEYSGSNANLKPETSVTTTGGVVYSPNWLPGFGASVDYYNIDISGAIQAISAQQLVNACYQGATSLCSDITRIGGAISVIQATQLNLAQQKDSGLDMEINYTTPLFDGNLTTRALATYLGRYVQYVPAAAPLYSGGSGSYPDWQANLTADYSQDAWAVIVSERFIGGVHRETPPTTIDLNDTPAAEYTALTLKYDFNDVFASPEIYLTINNLFDQNPRITATNGGQGADYAVTSSLYDVIGRYFTFGVRASL